MKTGRMPRIPVVLILLLLALPACPRDCGADQISDLVAQVSTSRIHDDIAALDFPRCTSQELAQASNYITQALSGCGYLVLHQPVRYSQNVIARAEGTVHPDQVFVIGAHFDTVYNCPGADDNASGVAALLEIARILAGIRPPYSIEFVAFTLEELYMVGSYAYVQQAQEQGKHIAGMICFDMIGYTCATAGCQNPFSTIPGCVEVDPSGVNVGDYAATLVNTASASLLATCDQAAGTYVPELERVRMQVVAQGQCFGLSRRSDHVPFWDAAIPAIEFLDTYGDRNPYYHTTSDRLETLDLEFCRRITQTALALVLESAIAAAPAPQAGSVPAGITAVVPNPARRGSPVRLVLSERSGPDRLDPVAVRLDLVDASGRVRRSLMQVLPPSGIQSITWDGRDNDARLLPPGVYFIRPQAGTESRKLVVIE